MRLLPLMLLVVCCSASAEWVKVTDSDEANFYIDFSTVRWQGRIVEFWALRNYFAANEDGVVSMRGYEQHDCKNKMYRVLELSFHSSAWADGKVIANHSYENKPNPWQRIPPQTVSDDIHKYACKK
jgi:hypothetical protein